MIGLVSRYACEFEIKAERDSRISLYPRVINVCAKVFLNYATLSVIMQFQTKTKISLVLVSSPSGCLYMEPIWATYWDVGLILCPKMWRKMDPCRPHQIVMGTLTGNTTCNGVGLCMFVNKITTTVMLTQYCPEISQTIKHVLCNNVDLYSKVTFTW